MKNNRWRAAVGTFVVSGRLPNRRLPMPRYFFDVADGHRLFDSSGFVCEDDFAALIRGSVLAIGVSLDTTSPKTIQSAASL
jgi:hypothetical protein